MADKSRMLRLVRLPGGSIEVDLKGNMPGRGAYACSASCLDAAIDRNQFGRALRCAIPETALNRAKEAVARIEDCKE